MKLGTATAISGLLVATAAAADPVRDEATGLAIDAPAGYVAEKIDGGARYAASFAIRKGDGAEPGCRVGFQAAPQNAGLSQAEINAFTAKSEWSDLIKATLALYYDVVSVAPFEQGGLAGSAVVGDVKATDGQPAPDARSYFVLVDTPKGRTTVVCVADKAAFDARRAEFEAVARSVQPPR
ncbi:hypothetical protein JOD31_002546 [Methylopila capsulata]|uniref:Uncharacterized protein n=1 Tax=Methylopila capsulata TaxID=61654 RepID=A0A9W6IUM1_9HYPH|nr:hypothetical protein [Methylopila capsulata]MBM7852304.1 hypothetical protein [Methylopila capsulata]GLK56513.1 hypothetical protein GCM10008170_25320 [Methylopila capsulata]